MPSPYESVWLLDDGQRAPDARPPVTVTQLAAFHRRYDLLVPKTLRELYAIQNGGFSLCYESLYWPIEAGESDDMTTLEVLSKTYHQDEAVEEFRALSAVENQDVGAVALDEWIQLRQLQGRAADAETLRGRLVERFPRSAQAANVMFLRGDAAHDRGDLARALAEYQRLVTAAPDQDRAGRPDARIEKGDVIRDPKLLDHGELMMFDRVIANPPFSQKDWGHEIASNDPFGRYGFGIPPMKKQGSDLAFLCHMIQSLAARGRAGVILPHGALFRGGTETDIRRRIVESDLLEAVIGLPPGLFYGTPIPAAILIINRAKPTARRERILFVDASRCFEKGVNQDHLRPQDLAVIVDAFKSFREVPDFARVVSRADIEAAQHEWRIETFVGPSAEAATVDHLGTSSVLGMIEDFSKSNIELASAVRCLDTARRVEGSKKTDLGPCPSTWNVLSFAELTEQVGAGSGTAN